MAAPAIDGVPPAVDVEDSPSKVPLERVVRVFPDSRTQLLLPEGVAPASKEGEGGTPHKEAAEVTATFGLGARILAVSIFAGMWVGWAMNKGGVPRPALIRETMSLSFIWPTDGIPTSVGNAAMLVLFLAASGTSAVVMGAIGHLTGFSAKQRESSTVQLGKNIVPVLVGLLLLGAGMNISGICPGTVWANIGSGNNRAPEYLAGGVAAAAAYLWFGQRFADKWPVLALPERARYLPDLLKLPPLVVSLLLGGMLWVVAIVLVVTDVYSRPYRQGFESDSGADYPPASPLFTAVYWPALAAGGMLGCVQLFLIPAVGNSMGCATSFELVAAGASKLLGTKAPKHVTERGEKMLRNFGWQGAFVVGMALGSTLASGTASPTNWSSLEDGEFVSSAEALLGSFAAVFGARIASGCTSGHGISGVGKLSTTSLLGVGAIFAGGALSGIPYRW